MNKLKERLLQELTNIQLSKHKKKHIIHKSLKKRHSQVGYKLTFATFLIALFSITLLFINQPTINRSNPTNESSSASTIHSLSNGSVLQLLISLLFWMIFIFLAIFIFKKKGYTWAYCSECGEVFTTKQLMRFYFKGTYQPSHCPHCHTELYISPKSMHHYGSFITLITMPIMTTFHFHFVIAILNILIASCIHLFVLFPYLVRFQKNDPSKEPQKPLW